MCFTRRRGILAVSVLGSEHRRVEPDTAEHATVEWRPLPRYIVEQTCEFVTSIPMAP